MAEPVQLPSGVWFIQFKFKGVRKSSTFSTKAAARSWEASTKAEILAGVRGDIPDKTFGAILERYLNEVSITKAGERWERVRIGMMLRDELARVKLKNLNSTHAASWRDRRGREVSAASVLREWNLLSNACRVAVSEWRWLKDNPFTQIRRPKAPPSRDRLFTCWETDAILAALGWSDGDEPDTVSRRVAYVLLWALETGMRCGEICALREETCQPKPKAQQPSCVPRSRPCKPNLPRQNIRNGKTT